MKLRNVFAATALIGLAWVPLAHAQDIVPAAFATADTNHNGCVDLQEFKVWREGRIAVEGGPEAALLKSDPAAPAARLTKKFGVLDAAKTGCLTLSEFRGSTQ